MIKKFSTFLGLASVLSMASVFAGGHGGHRSCDENCCVNGHECEPVDCDCCETRGIGGQGYDCATNTYLWDNGTLGSSLTLAGEPTLIDGCPNPKAGLDVPNAIAAQKFNTCHAGKGSDEIKSVQIAFMDLAAWAYDLFGTPGSQDLDQQFAEINPRGLQVKVKIWDAVENEDGVIVPGDVLGCQEYTIKCEDLGNEIGSNIRPLNSKCQAVFNVLDRSFPKPDSSSSSSSSCSDSASVNCEPCGCKPSNACDVAHACALPHTRRVDNSTNCPVGPNFYKQGSGFSVYPARFTTICFEHPVTVAGEFFVGIEVDLAGSGDTSIENDLDLIGISVIDATDCKKFGGAGFANNVPSTTTSPNPVIFTQGREAEGLIAGVDLATSLDEVLTIRANAVCDENACGCCDDKH